MGITNERVADHGFSGAKAAEIVGISYRQLDYWARTDLVRPTVTDAAGSGSRRRYGYTDLLELKVIKSLLDAGIRLENVREIFSYLRDILGQEITSANLVIQGSTSVVIQSDGELIDLIHNGQGVLNILPLGGVRDEMDARIRELRPPSEDLETATQAVPVVANVV
ncbi:MAG: MerR family transcriptional regulator [Actinobacteria bacterium]|nr:MerR family transcriptional regulator [Actinomycetota bacterium]